jgi:hypothetical protein
MAHPGIGFGERVPDFMRHDAAGTACFFYDQADGRPLLLAVCRSAAPADLALLAALAAVPGDETRVALVPQSPAALAAGPVGALPGIRVLADDGQVGGWLRGTRGRDHGLTLLGLDPNQRVVERVDLDAAHEVAAAHAALAALLHRPAWRVPGVVTGGAPALIVPRVFEDALCDELIALFERDGGQQSEVFELVDGVERWRVDPRYKMRRDYQRFDEGWNGRFADLIRARVLPEVDKCFAFRATGFEAFKLSRYDADQGGYHRPHRDNVSADVNHRRFAMSINLNSGDYEGGSLRFPEYGPELYQPPKGGAVVFSCSLLHEAMPVTRGRRYVFLTFFESAAVRGPHLYHAPR